MSTISGTPALDAQQKPVVEHTGGNLLVVAGAGSGKTHTITQRVAQHILGGESPGRIVMTTFTNKAASEMQSRLAGLLGVKSNHPDLPFVGTQHAFGMRLIRRYRQDVGFSRFSLLDDDDSERSKKRLLEAAGIEKEQLSSYLRMMDRLTNEGVAPCPPPWRSLEIPEGWKPDLTGVPLPGARDIDMATLHKVRTEYAIEKYKKGVLDVDDLLAIPLMLLRDNPGVLATLSRYLREVVVDEAQDLNGVQYAFWRLLSDAPDGGPRLVMVGDDDQAIYRWRDARPHFLMMFSQKPTTTVLRMENNYRSHAAIVEQASEMIQRNTLRLEKTPRATCKERGMVRALSYDSGHDIGPCIVQHILELRATNPQATAAILYRMHRLRDCVEEALIGARIRYEVKDGTAFLDRAEPKMVIALARLAANPYDDAALRRVAPALGGVGERALDLLCAHSDGPLSPMAIAMLPAKPAASLRDFVDRLADLRANGPRTLKQWLASYPPILDFLLKSTERSQKQRAKKNDLSPSSAIQEEMVAKNEARARVDRVIDFLCQSAGPINGEDAWEKALEVLFGAPETPESEGAQEPPVVVGTIHGAKGLEWDEVHIIGWSDGILPLAKTEDEEEERCLAYVAMTRGRERVVLHHARQYPIPHMSHLTFQPSPFSHEAGVVFEEGPQRVRRRSFPGQSRRMGS